MSPSKTIFILIIACLIPIRSQSDCLCKSISYTFLQSAKHSKDGVVALVEVIGQKTFDLSPYPDMPFLDPFPVPYIEVKVLKNLGSKKIGDTLNILLPGEVECCLEYPRIGTTGDSAFIHAYEWDEADYGYNHDEILAYAFSSCMIPTILVRDGYAVGPITRTKEQRMRVEKLLRRF